MSGRNNVSPLQKRKSEPDLKDSQFAPGQNHFSVLSNHDEPLPKKARSNMPEELGKTDQVSDSDNQKENLTTFRQVQNYKMK